MRTRQGQAAIKVIDRKLQSLMRKKAWRDGVGTPIHMGKPDFAYPIPDTHPDAARLDWLEKTGSDIFTDNGCGDGPAIWTVRRFHGNLNDLQCMTYGGSSPRAAIDAAMAEANT
ncbi:hypothetical protein OpiT1DRAFT_03878 [Opitutaceae bacterium TAV1]|nr:hypothetical protein OpiT1DRAFT_03878 [Opitutaceae bacterium TAV1]